MADETAPAMQDLPCALCGPGAPLAVKYPARLRASGVDFAARKTPAGTHFRYVRCRSCGLVFSSPVFPDDRTVQLYRDGPYTRDLMVDRMAGDYLEEFRSACPCLAGDARILEIGCADGTFLAALWDAGFRNVHGVEPGRDAVAHARTEVRDRIIADVLAPGLFPAGSFDVICVFQVLDHVTDPVGLVRQCHGLLKDGGMLLTVSHNVRSWLTCLLGRRWPIFDIEHVYLWDPATLRRLLEAGGFEVLAIRNLRSRYTLGHCIKMFPMPGMLKRLLTRAAGGLRLADAPLRLPAGNMAGRARKVAGRAPPGPRTAEGRT